jgi:hypothetical protein
MNACAKPFHVPKLSKFPQNKKWAFRLRNQAKNPVLARLSGNAPHAAEGKSQTKIPPKMDHPPWRLTGLYEKAPCAKNSASKQTTCSRRINYGSFISDGPKQQAFLNLLPRPKNKKA